MRTDRQKLGVRTAQARSWKAEALAAALVVGLPCFALAQQVTPPTFRVLVEDGQSIDNRPGEFVRPVLARDTIGIDRQGNGFFDGATTDSALTQVSNSAVFVADGDALRAVFAAGDPAPVDGISSGGSTIAFIDDDEVFYSPSGDVLAKVELSGGVGVGEALLTEFEGTQRLAAVRGIAFGGFCGVLDIGNGISTRQFAVNGDALVFHGALNCGDGERTVIRDFGELNGNVELLVIEGEPVPGLPAAEFDGLFSGPALNEDGAYVFAGRYRNPGTQELAQVLLVAEPDGALRVVDTSGSPLTDAALTSTGFATWTVGSGPTASQPRTAYVLVADNGAEPSNPAFRSSYGVLDTAIVGLGPRGIALETGNTAADSMDRDFVFAATPFDFSRTIAIAIANEQTLVVVGDTTGPDVPVGGEGVWRYDVDRGARDPLQVVLTEGGPIPGSDPRATGRKITRLLTVNVNEEGRIAAECELTGGVQAILLEESGIENAGRFRIAAQIGDTLPTSDGEGRLFGLLNELPSFPRVTGTGENGLQSRFNVRGEFVFRARIDPDDGSRNRTSLYTVSLDPPPVLCDVKVVQRGGNLSIVGDDSNCTITVHARGAGGFDVVPGAKTMVNGDEKTLSVAGVTGSVSIRMGSGDDTVTLTAAALPAKGARPFHVRKNLSVDTGDGSDTLDVTSYTVLGGFTLRTGEGGTETLRVATTVVGKAFKLSGGEQTISAEIRDTRIEGATKLSLPGRADDSDAQTVLDIRNCTLAKTIVKGSPFSDDVSIVDSDIVGALKVDPDRGDTEELEVIRCSVRGSVRIDARDAHLLSARIDAIEVTAGGIRCDASDTGCDITITGGRVDRDLVFRTQGVVGSSDLNAIVVDGVDVRRFLILKGRGSHRFDVRGDTTVGRGIGINTRDSTSDLIEFGSSEVTRGNVTIKTRTSTLQALLVGLKVRKGNLSVRGVGKPDSVTVVETQVSGTLLVALGDGNDTVSVNGSIVGRDLRLFGGAGTDSLENGTKTANTVTRETITDSFEDISE